MRSLTQQARRQIRERYKGCPIDAPMHSTTTITTLSDFFAVFHALLEPNKLFWFRGHSRIEFRLAPSALRYPDRPTRDRALSMIAEMRRFLEMKLPRPPATNDDLGWMQVAQHYGLPTRLLDWTQNAAVALFFACSQDLDSDGLVVIVNPIELNTSVDLKVQRILTMQNDESILRPYFRLNGASNKRGRPTLAINPTWNTERIALQQGVFTLHGSRQFELDSGQARSLLYVPILREAKASLLQELERVGIGEMYIFPEPEHVCAHLKRTAQL